MAYQLFFRKPLRYPEDIDLVQALAEPIGKIFDEVSAALPWLGKCNCKQVAHSMHLVFIPEDGSVGVWIIGSIAQSEDQQGDWNESQLQGGVNQQNR